MIFKSRQVNLDPLPYAGGSDVRYPDAETARHFAGELARFDPRPEFESTRDPEPWLSYSGHDRAGYQRQPHYRWRPRREQFDTPVNPILVAFRQEHGLRVSGWTAEDLAELAAIWLDARYFQEGASPEQIDHARRVLARLANLAEVQS